MHKLFKAIRNKKGFTMIEMIVALVILAIMAAIAVPSMVGFINRANERALLTEARLGLVAAQVCVTEAGGRAALIAVDTNFASDPHGNDDFLELITGVSGTFSAVKFASDDPANAGYNEVTGITYSDGTNTVTIP